jgi:hypothetical protein
MQNNRQQAQFVSTGNPETVSDDPSKRGFISGQLGNYVIVQQPGTPNPTAGEGQDEENRNKTYRYVVTDSTMSVAPFKGAVAWWADKSRFKVTTSPTAEARGRRAGVFQGAPTKGHACFIQTGGPATVKFVDGVAGGAPWATKGLSVIPSATAGKADTIAAGTAPTYPILGLSMGTGNAAAAEAVVDLDIPDTP